MASQALRHFNINYKILWGANSKLRTRYTIARSPSTGSASIQSIIECFVLTYKSVFPLLQMC